jgi:predicted porin
MHAIKKILPAAILAAFAGAAQAQTTLYGLVDMSYGQNKFVGDTTADFHSGADDGSSQGNSTTRFGIKGNMDVGSGIKAKFQLESNGINSDGGVNGPNFFNRQMWLGFAGGFGEVRLGRNDNVPYQVMSGLFDFNGASNGASAQAYTGVGVWNPTNGRQSRLLSYSTPTMSGVTAHVGFQPSENGVFGSKDNFSGAVTYVAGDLAVGVSGATKLVDGGEDYSSIAGSYDFKAVKVMAGYADSGSQNRGYVLGVNVPLAGNNIGFHYTENMEGNEARGAEVWINREIFKNTYAYGEYLNVETSGPAPKDVTESFSVGVIYVF